MRVRWNGRKKVLEERVRAEVDRRLDQMKLPRPRRPLNEEGKPLNPKLPQDLTALDDLQLGHLYTQFSRMAQYAQLQLAFFGVERGVHRQMEKRMRAEFRLQQEGTVSDKNDAVEANKDIQAVQELASVGEYSEQLTQGYLHQYAIGREACSRELTRRQVTGNSGDLRR